MSEQFDRALQRLDQGRIGQRETATGQETVVPESVDFGSMFGEGRIFQSVIDNFVDKPCPYVPQLWRVVIQLPDPPESTASGTIQLPKSVQERMKYHMHIGKVVAMGSLCYKAVTNQNVDLADEAEKVKVGDWVIFGRHAGEHLPTADGTRWVTMTECEVWGRLPNPNLFECDRL